MRTPKLIVISGPSGCGKTTIAQELLKRHAELYFSISATTRTKRSNEVNGKDYYFISKEQFKEKIQNNELAEWEQIYDDYYGTPIAEILTAFNKGRSVLLDVDVKGALSIKKKYPKNSVLIFIKPPSLEVLTQRLKNRKTESPEALKKRLERVTMELALANDFDHAILNDAFEDAINSADTLLAHALSVAA